MRAWIIATMLFASSFVAVSNVDGGWCFFRRWCRPVCYRPCFVYRPVCYTYRYCYPSYCYPTYYCPPTYWGPYCSTTPSTTIYRAPSSYVKSRVPSTSRSAAALAYTSRTARTPAPAAPRSATMRVLSSLGTPSKTTLVKSTSDSPLKVRVSNLETLSRARRMMAIGDTLFAKQRYHEALQDYKQAARIAPDLAIAYFRQGHALVATSQYDRAADAFKRGLRVDERVAAAKFNLDEIYADAKLAKSSHLETLAREALGDERNTDLMFLVGMFLHFDGQPARAKKFFNQAANIDAVNVAHLQPFLRDKPSDTPRPVRPSADTILTAAVGR